MLDLTPAARTFRGSFEGKAPGAHDLEGSRFDPGRPEPI